ncbi:tetratricopeptide repeat (TPR)-like superfamily protein isoform X2 [Wolffia australiana]
MREVEVIVGTSPLLSHHQPSHFAHLCNAPILLQQWRKPSKSALKLPPNLAIRGSSLAGTRQNSVFTSNPSSLPPSESGDAKKSSLLKYYAALASKLVGNGRLQDFLMIAESILASDAVSAGQSLFVARLNTRLISRGLSAILRRGELNEVIEFMGNVDKLGIRPSALFDNVAAEDLAVQCRELIHEGRLAEFVNLMEILAGFQFYIKRIVDPIQVIKMFVNNRDPDTAVRYAGVLPQSQLLFCIIIQEFGKKKDLSSALSAFEAVKQKSGGFNMFVCRTIIDVCGICGDCMRSRSLLKEFLAQKLIPNTHVFNSLMNVNAHDLSYTFYVYRKMQSLKVKLDITSYNILLKACCLSKRVDLAQDIYLEMKCVKSAGNVELDVITYSTMIKAFADAKMWEMALKIKEDMLLAGVNPNVVTWSSLISACANAGLVDQAIRVFEEMLSRGCEPNSQCCNILLHAFVKACQYDRAFRFYRSWKLNGFKVRCNPADRNAAEDLDSTPSSDVSLSDDQIEGQTKIVPFRPTTATFNVLMKACGTDYHHVKDLMNEMKEMGLSPNRISWSVLIDMCGSSCNMSGALQAFKTMRSVGIKPDVVAYTAAIKACVSSNNLKIAYSLFEEMKRFQITPNLVTYNTLLRARTKYGSLHDVRQCLAMYKEMRRSGYSANDLFLKDLLGEWCEGALNSAAGSRGLLLDTGESNSAQSPFIEKVAVLLQKDVSENQVVDLSGLTKIEARVVVLSVLRMIKESYGPGQAMDEDLIITGIGGEIPGHAQGGSIVKDAIIKLLEDELGLEVRLGQGKTMMGTTNLDVSEINPLASEKVPAFRRPRDQGMLRVTRESLQHWLQSRQWNNKRKMM